MVDSFLSFCQPSLSSDGCLCLQKFLTTCNSICQFLRLFPILLPPPPESLCLFLYLEAFYLFSSVSFKVSGLTFRSLIHCELISVQSERQGLNFILLWGFFYPVPPAAFVEEGIFFPQCVFLTTLLKISEAITVWVYFAVLYYISLTYTSVFQTCRYLQYTQQIKNTRIKENIRENV